MFSAFYAMVSAFVSGHSTVIFPVVLASYVPVDSNLDFYCFLSNPLSFEIQFAGIFTEI
ncbi:hypothetical protein AtNW77_Chr5g0105521 [Arabidopsis thaliana]